MLVDVEYKLDNKYDVWFGPNRSTFLPDLNIIHVVVDGEQTPEIADQQEEFAYKVFDLSKRKISFLIDLNKGGKNSPEARQKWIQLCEHERTNKVAVFGLHPVARVLASFVFTISKNKQQRFFKTQEDCMEWLLSE
jgi:hypothetical protein